MLKRFREGIRKVLTSLGGGFKTLRSPLLDIEGTSLNIHHLSD